MPDAPQQGAFPKQRDESAEQRQPHLESGQSSLPMPRFGVFLSHRVCMISGNQDELILPQPHEHSMTIPATLAALVHQTTQAPVLLLDLLRDMLKVVVALLLR